MTERVYDCGAKKTGCALVCTTGRFGTIKC